MKKFLTLVISVFLLSSLSFANEFDPTRALKMNKKDDKKQEELKAKSDIPQFELMEVSWAKPATKQEFTYDIFFDKDSKVLYLYTWDNGKRVAYLLSIYAKDGWKKGSKAKIETGRAYKNTYKFAYDPKTDKIVGASINNKAKKIEHGQYIATYKAEPKPKYITTQYAPYMHRGFSGDNIFLCRQDFYLHANNTTWINMKTGKWVPNPKLGTFKNSKNVINYKKYGASPYIDLSKDCNTFFATGYDLKTKQAYLRFVPVRASLQDKKFPIFNNKKGEKPFFIKADNKNRNFVVTNNGLYVAVYDKKGKELWAKDLKEFPIPGGRFKDTIKSVTFTPNGKMVALSQSSGAVSFIDAKTGAYVKFLKYPMPISSIAFSPDGKAMAISGSQYGDLYSVLVAKDGKPVF